MPASLSGMDSDALLGHTVKSFERDETLNTEAATTPGRVIHPFDAVPSADRCDDLRHTALSHERLPPVDDNAESQRRSYVVRNI
jgi:hypothetical protein